MYKAILYNCSSNHAGEWWENKEWIADRWCKKYIQNSAVSLCHINSITIVVNVENTQNKTKIAFPYIPYDKDNFIAYSE